MQWLSGRTLTFDRGDGGSVAPAAVSVAGQFRSPHIACVFRKAVGPFELLSVHQEDPMQVVNVYPAVVSF